MRISHGRRKVIEVERSTYFAGCRVPCRIARDPPNLQHLRAARNRALPVRTDRAYITVREARENTWLRAKAPMSSRGGRTSCTASAFHGGTNATGGDSELDVGDVTRAHHLRRRRPR